MSKLTLTGFRGAIQKIAGRLIPDGYANGIANVCDQRGDLRPWNLPLTTATIPANRVSIYRMGRDAPSDANYWLSWTTHVDVIRGLNPTDTTERIIFTGSGVPAYTDNTLALASAPYPTATRPLGVPAPATAPTIALHTAGPSGPTAVQVNVLFTYVTDRGEEGSISPVSNTLTVQPGSTLDVTTFPTIPAGNYGINRVRVYATNIGATTASYAFAAEVAYGTSTVTINLSALGATLETTDYLMPPADGHSIVALWQFAAMASGKAVYFCPIGLIYAWPTAFRMLTDSPVVGMGTFDQSLVVLTTGYPVLIQGSSPDAMGSQIVPVNQPCVSAASIVSFGDMVVWASPEGLFSMSGAGPRNLMKDIFTPTQWRTFIVPSTIVGEQMEGGLYFGSYTFGGTTKGFIIDPRRPDSIFLMSAGYQAQHYDQIQSALFVVSGTSVQKWNADTTPMTALWTSKKFRMSRPTSYSCGRIVADSFGQVLSFYADGVLLYTKTVTDGKPFRLALGRSWSDLQITISTTVPVVALIVGDDMREIEA